MDQRREAWRAARYIAAGLLEDALDEGAAESVSLCTHIPLALVLSALRKLVLELRRGADDGR